MNRLRAANFLIGTTAILLIVSGALHLSVFSGSISPLAQSATPEDIRAILPASWLAFGIDLIVLGLVVAAIGIENATGGRYALAAIALAPLGAAALQLVYFGFIAPTALLLLDGVLAMACAWIREPRKRRSS